MKTYLGTDKDFGGVRLKSVADPSAGTDAVNLNTLQLYVRGMDNKASVRAATTGAGTLVSSFENGDVIDGVTLATGDRILIKNQAAGATNGIYTVAASGAPVRATDADISAEVTAGLIVYVSEGTTLGNTNWQLTTDDPITLDTTALVFTQVGVGTIYTAGAGLDLTGVDFSVNAGTGLEISSDTVRIAAAAAGAGLIGGAGSALAVGAGTGITVNADDVALAATVAGAGMTHTAGVLNVIGDASITVAADSLGLAAGVSGAGLTLTTGVLAVGAGTGISVAADSVAVDSTVARVFSTGTHASTTSIAITHSLGKQFVVDRVYITATGEQIECDTTATSTTVTTFGFAVAPGANTLTFVIMA